MLHFRGRSNLRAIATAVSCSVLLLAACADVVGSLADAGSQPRPALNAHRLTKSELAAFERSVDFSKGVRLLARGSEAPQPAGSSSGLQAAPPNSICDLGPACGQSEVTQQYWNFLGWASTYTSGNPGIVLTLDGGGVFTRGSEFPNYFYLGCHTISAQSCSDAVSFEHTCSEETNAMTVGNWHTAILGGNLYGGATAHDWECVYEGSSGSGEALTCYSETFTIETWNPETGAWEFWGTRLVEVCE